ncbi:MAG: GIY-YIG nuclease family protein, partial [Clostridiales bacterium]|nr:GIY-YIG nuclease family protein [Clostridiales bacterium]
MNDVIDPIVEKIVDDNASLKSFQNLLNDQSNSEKSKVLLQYPTVYIHNWENTEKYEVYIGESNDVIKRTRQHYDKSQDSNAWQNKLLTHNAYLYIIGHKHFNKSLTLDIENRLI